MVSYLAYSIGTHGTLAHTKPATHKHRISWLMPYIRPGVIFHIENYWSLVEATSSEEGNSLGSRDSVGLDHEGGSPIDFA